MIARHEKPLDKNDIWSALSAPLPPGVISWRQDGRPMTRDGRHFARFVAYIEANTVRERLDSVVPGEWDLHLEPLPTVTDLDDDANQGAFNFKARLQILGVIREDVGTGKDYKQASTDAFKRAAVRFGIAHELYAYEQNWVQMDGDGKYAKPVEDPAVAYARRYGKSKSAVTKVAPGLAPATEREIAEASMPEKGGQPHSDEEETSVAPTGPRALDEMSCPKCGGRMWDNRLTKRNPKAPDYKCRDRACDGVIWPPKGEKSTSASAKPGRESDEGPHDDAPPQDDDDLPF
jgi:hypothetical protein